MTLDELKAYLRGHGAGIDAAQLVNVANVAAEAGYKGVWGAYPWTVRRASTNLATVASQEYSVLPADFESAVTIRYSTATRRHVIDILDEPKFDEDFPYPLLTTGVPLYCKIVYHGANLLRVYWYPVPDAVYSLPLAYNRKADLSNLPNLPGWMVNAIVHKSLVLMESSVEGQLQRQALASQAIQEAITADAPVTGIGPKFGADPGWDDFDTRVTSTESYWP